jgi:hypothetical protein
MKRLNDSSKGKAEYDQATKEVIITKGEVRLELPGEFDTLADAKAAALHIVERLRGTSAKDRQVQ